MTLSERNESIEYIKGQLNNGYVDISSAFDKNEIQIIEEAISALILINQIRWERDVAVEQLADLGLSLGQKIEGYYITEDEYDKLIEYKHMYEDLCK
jgi:hypothetical protein